MSYVKSAALEATGFVILRTHDQAADPQEWRDLEYLDWKSAGDTRFAPLASADGTLNADGFWNHEPPRTDKYGVWVESQAALAPTLVRRAQEPGANIGRCRVIELRANTYADALYNMHQDDNNRLNPDESGWIVRGFFNLTHNPDSVLILREDRYDPSSEVRLPLPAGSRIIVDTQRFWHATWHTGDEPRYSLITSWTSGPELDAYIAANGGTSDHTNPPLAQDVIDAAQAEVQRRLAERADALAEKRREGRGGGGGGGGGL